MIITNAKELESLQNIGIIVAIILNTVKKATVPGITTKELDDLAGKKFKELGAVSAPILDYDFPGHICISVNNEVAHGIPGSRIIRNGDVVNIDVSGVADGFYSDTGISFIAGEDLNHKQFLCDVAKEAFDTAMTKVKTGKKLALIGKSVTEVARKHQLFVIKNLTGHGIGRSLHEAPKNIVNYYDPWNTEILKEGHVLAIEPFIAEKTQDIIEGSDGWTYLTPDNSYTAQYEHTIVVTNDKPLILTQLDH